MRGELGIISFVALLSCLVEGSDELFQEHLVINVCSEDAKEIEKDIEEPTKIREYMPPLASYSGVHCHLSVKEKVGTKQQLIPRQLVSLSSVKRHVFLSEVSGCIPHRTDLEIQKLIKP